MSAESEDAKRRQETFDKMERSFNKLGLNGEVLITMVSEFTRLVDKSDHQQVHALHSLLEVLAIALDSRHRYIRKDEGRKGFC